MNGTFITIPDRYTARGITFLPHGQQYSSSLPIGDYDYLGECDVCYTDLGKPCRSQAGMFVHVETGEKWYVGLGVAEWLLENHRREPARFAD